MVARSSFHKFVNGIFCTSRSFRDLLNKSFYPFTYSIVRHRKHFPAVEIIPHFLEAHSPAKRGKDCGIQSVPFTTTESGVIHHRVNDIRNDERLLLHQNPGDAVRDRVFKPRLCGPPRRRGFIFDRVRLFLVRIELVENHFDLSSLPFERFSEPNDFLRSRKCL